jgi:chromosome segregation ATPase
MSANLDTALTRYQRRTGLQPDGYAAPDGPTVQQIAAEAEADDTPPLPARKPGSDVTPASPDKRRTIGATREQRADPSYEGTEADKLIADIKNTQRRIELADQRIEAIAAEIESERATLRDTITELVKEAADAANKRRGHRSRSQDGEARKGRGQEVLDNLSTGIGVADLPEDIATARKAPEHIQNKQKEIERLYKQREKLERELDRLRAEKEREYPRQVPAWD